MYLSRTDVASRTHSWVWELWSWGCLGHNENDLTNRGDHLHAMTEVKATSSSYDMEQCSI